MIDTDGFPFDFETVLKRVEGDELILVLGGVDTGKTTLIKALYRRLGGKVVDSDVGQPDIGPPGLISRGTYEEGMNDAYFVGDITPRGNLVQVMVGISKMVKEAGVPCFLDTDGWVDGDAAEVYKSELIEMLEPDGLILLEKGNELDKFGLGLPDPQVIRIPAQETGKKSPGERAANRTRRFKYYFSRTKKRFKKWDQVSIRDYMTGLNGRTELVRERHKNRLVGCYKRFDFRGLGTVRKATEEGIEIFAPSEDFYTLKLGKIKVKPSGRQIG